MTDGRRREAWAHTAALMALLANINRDSKRKPSPFSPDDFGPFAKPPAELTEQEKAEATTDFIHSLAAAWGIKAPPKTTPSTPSARTRRT